MYFSSRKRVPGAVSKLNHAVSIGLEPLEDRRLMSASPGGFGRDHGGFGGEFGGGFGGGFGEGGGHGGQTIAFSLAPTAVQTGLDSLATADGLTDPTSTQLVTLGNSNGVETYSVTIDGTGTISRLTVDQLGDAVTAPTQTTTTWATLSGTGTGSDSAAATEISAIATALDLTAPASTDTVNVTTTSAGAVSYSIQLSPSNSSSSSTTTDDSGPTFDDIADQNITVDSAGNPIGNQRLPFSVFSTTIQDGLNKAAPTGATSLASTSTQSVDVATVDGIVTYSTTFTTSGTDTKVTVNSAGTAISLPATTTTTFSALTTAVQTEIQTLATADGVTTTIASNQSVSMLTESTGTILYSVTLSASGTARDGTATTFDVTVTVDSDGNPTTLPNGGGFGGRGNFGGGGGDCGPGTDGSGSNSSTGSNLSSGSNSSTGSSSNSSGGLIISPPATGVESDSSVSNSYTLTARVLSGATSGLGMLNGYFVDFAPSTVSATVKADLTAIQTARKTLATDTKALSAADKKTLASDEKAITAAIKAISSTLAPLEATLRSDAATWNATLKTDEKAVLKSKKGSTALTTAKAQLATDKASAFAAIATDQLAIQTSIDNNTSVAAARATLAMSLPTIASDQSAILAAQTQLITNIEA
jgi:hypothetical protein